MKKHLLWILVVFALLLNSSMPSPYQNPLLQNELAALTKRGFTYRMLDNDLIELTDPVSGTKQLKSLREPSEGKIRAWAASRGIPILEIDPALVDTNQYTGWYKYWNTIPLSNGSGKPLLVGDVDKNGRPEIYGVFKDFDTDFMSRIYEVTTDTVILRHEYIPRRGPALQLTDVDKDSLKEVVLVYGDSVFIYEQTAASSLPTLPDFNHALFEAGNAVWTNDIIASFDDDSLTDFLYRGSGFDSSGSPVHTYVAEFSPGSNNFRRVWTKQLNSEGETGLGGYCAGDFDNDGRMEFVASALNGYIYTVENVNDNSYAQIYNDSLPFVNLFYQTAGDVDGDGKSEFFVGATDFGNWTTMFESDSNDRYSPKFIFHLLSGGVLDEPVYLTRDVDGDGRPELTVFSGTDLYVFKSNADNQYYLWYLRREDARDGFEFYDFDADGNMDLVVSKRAGDSQGRIRLWADIYVGTPIVGVDKSTTLEVLTKGLLSQNYPNPFNLSSTIKYTLLRTDHVRIDVYDILGKHIQTLLDQTVLPGKYSLEWNAAGLQSGVYFLQLRTSIISTTVKMLLLK